MLPKTEMRRRDYIAKLNQLAMRDSDEFFDYERPQRFLARR